MTQVYFRLSFLPSFYGQFLQPSRSNIDVNSQLRIIPTCFKVQRICKSLECILFIDIINFNDRDLGPWTFFFSSFSVFPLDSCRTTIKKKSKYRNPVSHTELFKNLILGLMPSVDRQQHNFQAGNMRRLLSCGCSLSLREEPRC